MSPKVINLQTKSEQPRKCKDGILNSYLFYGEETECHEDFHYWMGINLIAGAMGRKFFLDMGFGSVFPNLYTVLVGEAGLSGKSTAIGMAGRVYKEAYPGTDYPLLAQKISPSSLIGELGRIQKEGGEDKAEGILISDELSTLLGDTRRDDEILKVLTTLWDCHETFELSTRMRGREVIRNTCLNLWGGSTPTWLKTGIPESSLEGGFFSRLILVNRPRGGKKIALPYMSMTDEHVQCYQNIVHDISRIMSMHGHTYRIEPPAERLYTEWYEGQFQDELDAAGPYMRTYFARKRTSVLKIGMILSMSRADDFLISRQDIHEALELLEQNEVHLGSLISYLGSSKDGMDLEYFKKEFLKQWNGPDGKHAGKQKRVAHNVMLRRLSHKFGIMQFESMIRILEEQDFLETRASANGRGRNYYTTNSSFLPEHRM
jgi:hypothetical protein